MYELENDNTGWKADRDTVNLRLGYRTDDLDLNVGYSDLEISRAIDQNVIVTPGFLGGTEFVVPVFYQADTSLLDAHVRWRTESVTVGADVWTYDNDGSFALSRDDYRAFVDVPLGAHYLVHVGYRSVDYDEDAGDFDDYDANIAEISVGYRW